MNIWILTLKVRDTVCMYLKLKITERTFQWDYNNINYHLRYMCQRIKRNSLNPVTPVLYSVNKNKSYPNRQSFHQRPKKNTIEGYAVYHVAFILLG